MNHFNLDQLRLELSVKAKNGIAFIVTGVIIWSIISVIWTLPYDAKTLATFTFYAAGLFMPMAFGLSKVFKTVWKLKGNPLQSLGMYLNVAQLFYFPFILIYYNTSPEYFLVAYIIITGAHFFPFAWFYKVKSYAVMAGIISFGAMIIGWLGGKENIHYLPLFMTACMAILSMLIWIEFKANKRKYEQLSVA